MSLKVEALDSIAALEAVEKEWRELWERDRCATPFQHPAWLLPWTRHVWGGGKLRVVTVREGGRLAGLAPLFLWGFGGRPEIVRVAWLGAGISDHLGMLTDPGCELGAARAVLDHLAESTDWHVCELDELRPGSALLRAEPPGRLALRDAPATACPALALPRSMEELTARLSTKFRKNLRQAETRLLRDGAILRQASTAEVPETMGALFRLHAARWNGRRETGVLASEALQRFHLEAAVQLSAHGLLRLHTLQIGGAVAAVQYNLWGAGRLFYYLSGFDPAHARYSPGSALLAWTIRQAIDEGAVELDFLRHREEYKYQWGARDRVSRKLLIAHSTAYARDVA